MIDFSRHRRDPAHGRVLQPAAGAPAPPLRRRPGLHRVLRLAPGRDQEGLRGLEADAGEPRRGRSPSSPGRCRTCRSTRSDVGRTYEAVIRVNSQSGKGGVAYIMKAEHQLDLPRRLQIEFTRVVQARTDAEGGEVTPGADLGRRSRPSTSTATSPLSCNSVHTSSAAGEKDALDGRASTSTARRASSTGVGNGPIAAFVRRAASCARDRRPGARLRRARAVRGRRRQAAAYVECAVGDQILWGVGIDANIVTASLEAVISAVNRARGR